MSYTYIVHRCVHRKSSPVVSGSASLESASLLDSVEALRRSWKPAAAAKSSHFRGFLARPGPNTYRGSSHITRI